MYVCIYIYINGVYVCTCVGTCVCMYLLCMYVYIYITAHAYFTYSRIPLPKAPASQWGAWPSQQAASSPGAGPWWEHRSRRCGSGEALLKPIGPLQGSEVPHRRKDPRDHKTETYIDILCRYGLSV